MKHEDAVHGLKGKRESKSGRTTCLGGVARGRGRGLPRLGEKSRTAAPRSSEPWARSTSTVWVEDRHGHARADSPRSGRPAEDLTRTFRIAGAGAFLKKLCWWCGSPLLRTHRCRGRFGSLLGGPRSPSDLGHSPPTLETGPSRL